jgi:hypothetical protein
VDLQDSIRKGIKDRGTQCRGRGLCFDVVGAGGVWWGLCAAGFE